MKKLSILVFFLCALPFCTELPSLHAQPFLVCDPPSEDIHHYEIMGLGPETSTAQPDPTRQHGFKTYTVTARACNIWECGDASVPLELKRPSKPVSPQNVDILFTSGN